MKFINTIVLVASTVSAAAVKRQARFYYVRDFYAGCIPHSTLCNYNFTVQASSASRSPTTCTLTLQGPDLLPEVDLTGCSASGVYTWGVTKPADGGLTLTVTTALSATSNLTGTYDIPASNLTLTQNGASISQSYIGPQGFDVPTTVIDF